MYPAFFFQVPFSLSGFSIRGLADKAQDQYDQTFELGWIIAQTFATMPGDCGVTIVLDVIMVAVESC